MKLQQNVFTTFWYRNCVSKEIKGLFVDLMRCNDDEGLTYKIVMHFFLVLITDGANLPKRLV